MCVCVCAGGARLWKTTASIMVHIEYEDNCTGFYILREGMFGCLNWH